MSYVNSVLKCKILSYREKFEWFHSYFPNFVDLDESVESGMLLH